MILYKYRSTEKWEYILDIINKKRLFCSKWDKLNDPLEGYFTHNQQDDQILQMLTCTKNELRVCSLSSDPENHLMWSHYASGFQGLVFELNISDNDIYHMNYTWDYFHIDLAKCNDSEEKARAVLHTKYAPWSYEKEVRIIQKYDWYDLGNNGIRRVIYGHRIESQYLEELKCKCQEENLNLDKASVDYGRINFEAIYCSKKPLSDIPASDNFLKI